MKSTVKETAEKILMEIQVRRQEKQHLLVAIDGRCAAGKTTIAAKLQELCSCNVIHMDHFFCVLNSVQRNGCFLRAGIPMLSVYARKLSFR